jgi:hypothetical protein
MHDTCQDARSREGAETLKSKPEMVHIVLTGRNVRPTIGELLNRRWLLVFGRCPERPGAGLESIDERRTTND